MSTHADSWKGQPRPSYNHPAVVDLMVEELFPALVEWLADFHDIEPGDAREPLGAALARHDDAYARARYLERYHDWAPDEALVELLASASPGVAHRQVLATWVTANGLTPRLGLGARVTVREFSTAHEGEIVDVDLAHGTYTVMIPSLGHVREGVGTHGHVLTWEVVEALNGVQAQEVTP